ncbi:hypothetical protein TanjilG_26615 [Lupinus angustifolius]|uniref:Tyrosinase copper-binding domain-containing protein n=1 Tax=Lupinus angustifolius TaxID=3871 RepID=A0A4P1QPT7_LUPAN|nr:PREDICTED: polyphenol oxidase, chloroplastic-like [Lupinus angustifolius]OIV91762.1 hypothetical protein TanjilG_26615 [Lupinus angustifolius]
MASLYPSPPLSITANNGASGTSLSFRSFLLKNPKTKASKVAKPNQYYVSRVSCKATKDDNNDTVVEPTNDLGIFDRRDMLIGLGAGLYGTTATLTNESLSLAAPILAPDLSKCHQVDPVKGDPINCCPPFSSKIIDFKFPLNPKVKVRPAAHLVDETYIKNYKEAVRRMKALPADDPRNFTQQANIHCAYCDGAYPQPGSSDADHVVQVHNSWLFFPFHRWYIFFYERILASLIEDLDPNFTIPFWSWDNPKGMTIPSFYTELDSPLYDTLRDPNNQPPKLVNLNLDPEAKTPVDNTITPEEQVLSNLRLMYTQLVSGSKTPSLFFGDPIRAGDKENLQSGGGSVESSPHGPVHVWTGRPRSESSNGEDMGNLYSAGRDPIFYSHHANVDRLWTIWKGLGKNRRDIQDPDWLESEFLFYDEKKNLVRVKVKDSLDTKKLGYVYQDVDIPWLHAKPSPQKSNVPKGSNKKHSHKETKFPLALDSIVSIVVKRPKKSRSKEEKEQEEEVLVIEGIQFEEHFGIKFDVYINDEDVALGGPIKTEFAGTFVHVPHKHKHGKEKKMKTRQKFGITELLEDLGAEDDESVLVTLVPMFKKGRVTIEGIKIVFDK